MIDCNLIFCISHIDVQYRNTALSNGHFKITEQRQEIDPNKTILIN
jgi:hypothetical protein